MANLYDLKNDYLELARMAESVDAEAFKDTLESIEEEIGDKLGSYIGLIRTLENDVEGYKVVKKQVDDKMKSIQGKIVLLKNIVEETVEQIGVENKKTGKKRIEINSPFVKSAWIQSNPPSYNVVDASLVPDEFKETLEPKVDIKSLTADYKTRLKAFDEAYHQEELKINQWVADGDISEEDGREELAKYYETNKPQLPGVEIKTSEGVRYK
jgi:Siphovirus Gp157